MAKRPIFIPKINDSLGVKIKFFEFTWFPGMATIQNQKSIASLHDAAKQDGVSPVLEISSKSNNESGVALSAFNLSFTTKKHQITLSVETAFQGSKVFERGGPYFDLYEKTSREAKKDIRLKESGNLVGFKFFGESFDLLPTTHFYDWVYINALRQNEFLSNTVLEYSGFTDIVFNPDKSLNCQAYSAALYVSLCKNGLLDKALKSRHDFLEILRTEYDDKKNSRIFQRVLI